MLNLPHHTEVNFKSGSLQVQQIVDHQHKLMFVLQQYHFPKYITDKML